MLQRASFLSFSNLRAALFESYLPWWVSETELVSVEHVWVSFVEISAAH